MTKPVKMTRKTNFAIKLDFNTDSQVFEVVHIECEVILGYCVFVAVKLTAKSIAETKKLPNRH